MGLFTKNYAKPGKGITKEEAARRSYFDIFGRHFSDLVKLNMLFILSNVLFIAAATVLFKVYFSDVRGILSVFQSGQRIVLPLLPFVPFMFMGPFTAGFTYVLRNWSRQEHAFLFSDYFEHSWKNVKQGLCVSVFGTLVTYLLLNAFIFYLQSGMPTFFVLFVAALAAILLLSMSFYIFPMMVTFDMKLREIVKNAWIFAMAKLPQNIFYLAVIVLVHGLLLWYVPIVWTILMLFILISWTGFTVNYYAWHVIDKHMMTQVSEAEEEPEEDVFTDTI
ncbi:MAG: DUF624 domain-containing protein [Ruminococcaceae bacterium]|nr:DUF624 domain-containing protein [Oscillospiraceae bacterium]